MAAKTKKQPITANQLVAAMADMPAAAAAYLVGLSTRQLRDMPTIPRTDDGGYDGRQLVEWSAGRLTAVKLSNEDLEPLLSVVNMATEGLTRAGVAALTNLEREHGAAGLAAFGRLLLYEWTASVESCPNDYAELTDAEISAAGEQSKHDEIERQRKWRARNMLRVRCICDGCGKIRNGRKWATGVPPAGYVTLHDTCPACDEGKE